MKQLYRRPTTAVTVILKNRPSWILGGYGVLSKGPSTKSVCNKFEPWFEMNGCYSYLLGYIFHLPKYNIYRKRGNQIYEVHNLYDMNYIIVPLEMWLWFYMLYVWISNTIHF